MAAWRELRCSRFPRVGRDGRRSPAYEIALFLAEKARRGCTGGGGFQYCLSTLDHRRIVLALRQCRRGMPITEISTLLKSWLLWRLTACCFFLQFLSVPHRNVRFAPFHEKTF